MFTIRLEQESSGMVIRADHKYRTVAEAEAYATSVILDMNEIFSEENCWTYTIEEF